MFSCTFFILSFASLNKGSASLGKFSCSPFSFPFVANVAFLSRSPKGDLLSSPLFSLSMNCKHNEVFDIGLCWNLSDIFQVWVSSPDFKCSLKNFLLWTTWSHNESLSSNKLTLKESKLSTLFFFFKLAVLAVTLTQKCSSSVDNGWILCQSNYSLLKETYVYIFKQRQLISLVMRT